VEALEPAVGVEHHADRAVLVAREDERPPARRLGGGSGQRVVDGALDRAAREERHDDLDEERHDAEHRGDHGEPADRDAPIRDAVGEHDAPGRRLRTAVSRRGRALAR
jgi:hypothetical protein